MVGFFSFNPSSGIIEVLVRFYVYPLLSKNHFKPIIIWCFRNIYNEQQIEIYAF